MMQIPLIINQIWNDLNVPDQYEPLIETWRQNHPYWRYKLWTYEMSREFIKDHYPAFLTTYDAYPRDIQRVDAARYFILNKQGGLFVDIDFECIKNIEELLDDQNCVMGIEPEGHCTMLNKDVIICNAFMACTPQNDFLSTICEDLQNKTMPVNKNARMNVLESTGPFKLTEMYNSYENKGAIKLLPADTIYPLTMMETRELLVNDAYTDDIMQAKIDNAYAIHYFLGTWWE
jgi:mannosyltransferase OCH1-like enzyme